MTDLKRLEVKYIRDYCKSAYNKENECYICGNKENLQMHHFYTMSLLWNKWKKENNVIITDTEEMNIYKEEFAREHVKEIFEEVVTLCKFHHMDRLHGIYGKEPPLSTALKQKNWCKIQKEKYRGDNNVNSIKEHKKTISA